MNLNRLCKSLCRLGSVLPAAFVLLLLNFTVGSAIAQIRDKSVEELVKQMADSDTETRRDAVYELVRRQSDTAEVVTGFAKLAHDSDEQVQFQSLMGLARLGNKSAPAIESLVQLLSDRGDQVRYRASVALGKIGVASIQPLMDGWESYSSDAKIAAAHAFSLIGEEAKVAMPRLTDSLREGSSELRQASAMALAVLSDNEDDLLSIASSDDEAVRLIGIDALAALTEPSEQTTEKLTQALSDSNAKVREKAIISLSKSSLPVAVKKQFVEAALQDESDSVRAAGIVAMRKADFMGPDFADRIADQLQHVSGGASNAIVKAVAAHGEQAFATLPRLLEVADKDEVDQDLLAATIAGMGSRVITPLLDALQARHELEPVVSKTLAILGDKAVDSLIDGISSDSEIVRLSATRALGSSSNASPEMVEHLAGKLQDVAPAVRAIAASSLIQLGDKADFCKDDLLELVHDEEASVRAVAVGTLAHQSHDNEMIADQMRSALADISPDVRSSAVRVVRELKLPEALAKNVVPLTDDDQADVRRETVLTLRQLGSGDPSDDTKELVSNAILKVLHDTDQGVLVAAIDTAGELKMTSENVLAALEEHLVEPEELLTATLRTLVSFGKSASSLAPTISNLLNHERPSVRVAAVEALSAVQPDRVMLAGRLTDVLADSEWEVRRVAADALGDIGPDAKMATPQLFRMLESEEDSDFASGALREIDAAPVEAIPLFMESLKSEDRRTAFYSVMLLGKIGPDAIEALPVLEKMMGENSEGRRSDFRTRFLREAIARIKGEEIKDD